MNLLELVAKQMRQRALSSWLTLLSVTLGVALAIALLVAGREADKLFGQTQYGYDLIVGAKGSRLQLVLNTVYGLDEAPGTVPWTVYESLLPGGKYGDNVTWAVPVAVTDNVKGHRIFATLTTILGVENDGTTPLPPEKVFQYRPGKTLQLAEGKAFHGDKFEAVIGSETARQTGFKIGDTFQATHGGGEAGDGPVEVHQEIWTVVGILGRTGTAFDNVVLLPMVSSVAIEGHGDALEDMAKLAAEAGVKPAEMPAAAPPAEVDLSDLIARGGVDHEHYVQEPDTGVIHLKIPQDDWQVSGIFVSAASTALSAKTAWQIDHLGDAMAVSPAKEMGDFFAQFLAGPLQLFLAVTALVTVVAAVSILVSIYNSVSARRREIAVLRSLGATRRTILALICVEAGLIGLVGSVLGWLLGHLLAVGAGEVLRERLGEGINGLSVGWTEFAYLAGVIVLAVLAGLVPALKAYSTPVAQNLSE